MPPAAVVLKTVRVAVPLPVHEVFTYTVPHRLSEVAQKGHRVLVPFGSRTLTGVVVGETTETGDFREILDVLDDVPAFTEEMLHLNEWVADYYLCGLGEVIRAALPSGIELESKRRVRLTGNGAIEESGDIASFRIIELLQEHPSGLTIDQLNRRAAPDMSLWRLKKLAQAGVISVETEVSSPDIRVRRQTYVRLSSMADGRPIDLKGEKQRAVLDELRKGTGPHQEGLRKADLLSRTSASSATLKSLVDKGIVETYEQEMIRTPLGDLPVASSKPPIQTLHPEQERALASVVSAIQENDFHTFLLHGVTGSGKTEVYIRALKAALERGKTAIVLVPEIALTPQTVQRFRAHFGDAVAVLHSRMSNGERYDAWRHLRSGKFSIAIGPRSAVLAPLSNIGLIVVDEEHETSYKQFDPAPRYNARDVAVMRASMNGAVCILGSATPSLESYSNARRQKYKLLQMTGRVPISEGRLAALPQVQVVDLTLENRKKRLHGTISEVLRQKIEDRLQKSEQVILLQNRRGYAPIIECMDCGWTRECSDCAVTMTYHKSGRHLRCHYCGKTASLPNKCPDCGSLELAQLGAGTQKVEEELVSNFPDARLLRMDMDTTSRKDAHRRLLDKFGQGKADILIGTQMVAKGLDFSRVTLVGVINADTGMLLPDFRSSERTFQLLAQVAGRAGRGELAGEVIIQTRNPKHPAIIHSILHDYKSFADREIEERRSFLYPPYSRLILIEVRGSDAVAAQRLAHQWTDEIRERSPKIRALGPEQAFIGRVKKLHRFQTILKLSPAEVSHVKKVLVELRREIGTAAKDCRVVIDVDPAGTF